MSASLVYRPVRPIETKRVDISACEVRHSLIKLFGDYPITLNTDNLVTLEVLRDLHDDVYSSNPYHQIIRLIGDNPDGIQIWEER